MRSHSLTVAQVARVVVRDLRFEGCGRRCQSLLGEEFTYVPDPTTEVATSVRVGQMAVLAHRCATAGTVVNDEVRVPERGDVALSEGPGWFDLAVVEEQCATTHLALGDDDAKSIRDQQRESLAIESPEDLFHHATSEQGHGAARGASVR